MKTFEYLDIKMYMSEVPKSKISDLQPQKMIILWKLKHVSPISEHPAIIDFYTNFNQVESCKGSAV